MNSNFIPQKISILLLCFISQFDVLGANNSASYSIVGVGDIVIGLNYPDDNPHYPIADKDKLFANVKEFISSADLAVGNLEGVFLDSGGTPKKCKDETKCYLFRMSKSYAGVLKNAGFDAMSIANNHARDFGDVGLKSTMATLTKEKIAFAGVQNICETSIIDSDSIKYGFCAFSPNGAMVSLHDYEYATALVQSLKEKCDIVIVSIHGGAEGARMNRVPRAQEIYLEEKRGDVYKFAHAVIDAGADVVFGHGPHVVRGIELYRNRLIAYSLGNFCTPYGVNKMGLTGYAPVVKVNVTKEGEFVSGEILSAIQAGRTGPVPDKNKVVIKEIARLSRLDFPESNLIIDTNGEIKKK